MESFKLTKSKITEMMSLCGNILRIADSGLFYNDMIYPVLLDEEKHTISIGTTLNGLHLIQNTIIPVKENIAYVIVPNEIARLKEKLKETGLPGITYYLDEMCIMILIGEEKFYIMNNFDTIDKLGCKLYNSYTERFQYLMNLNPYIEKSTSNDIRNIIMGLPVLLHGKTVEEKDSVVRVSRNIFPFIGSVRLGSDDAFTFQYSMIHKEEPYVVLFTKYKKFNAIHIYAYIEYYEG